MFPLNATQISRVVKVPEHNVGLYWPVIEVCLDALNVGSDNSKIAAIATITEETAYHFAPIKEFGSEAYLRSKKYYPFVGRGFGQLTWEDAYRQYGNLLGVDLVADPDKALDPNLSASIFAAQWRDKKCNVLADAGDWRHVRIRWNGGTNGMDDYLHHVAELQEAISIQAEKAAAV